jgi:hypothetical protein
MGEVSKNRRRWVIGGLSLAMLVLAHVLLNLPSGHSVPANLPLTNIPNPLLASNASPTAIVKRGTTTLTVDVAPELAGQCLVGNLKFEYGANVLSFSILLDGQKFNAADYAGHPWHYAVYGVDGQKAYVKPLEVLPGGALYPGETIFTSMELGEDYFNRVEICP